MRNRIKVIILKSQFMKLIIRNEGRASQMNMGNNRKIVVLTPKHLKPFHNPVKAIKYLMKYEKNRTRSPYK